MRNPFIIEQIALCPANPEAAKELLSAMSMHAEFVEDHVVAEGNVFGQPGRNEANLSFNYGLSGETTKNVKPLEVEVLNYTEGPNWMQNVTHSVSHIGMHCTDAQLTEWRKFFLERGIGIAQEVITESHNNPAIAGMRRYNYVIFDTREILGVDVKFIVRLNPDGHPYEI